MASTTQYIDVDADEFEDAPKGLRDAYKALRKAHEAQSTELDGVRGRLASVAVGDVLKAQGFKNPKRVEKDLLAEGVDPLDKEAVDGWLAEFGDDYAKGAEAPPADPAADAEAQQLAAAHSQMQLGAEFHSSSDTSKYDLAASQLTPDMTPEQVRQHLINAGM